MREGHALVRPRFDSWQRKGTAWRTNRTSRAYWFRRSGTGRRVSAYFCRGQERRSLRVRASARDAWCRSVVEGAWGGVIRRTRILPSS